MQLRKARLDWQPRSAAAISGHRCSAPRPLVRRTTSTPQPSDNILATCLCRRSFASTPLNKLSRLPCLASAAGLSTGSIVRTSTSEIRWGSFVSTEMNVEDAVNEAVDNILNSIGEDAEPELAIVFAHSVHGTDLEDVIPALRERLPSLKHIFGCSGFGIIGGNPEGPQEIETEPALSLTLARLPGVEVKCLHTLRSRIPSRDASPEDWGKYFGVPHDTKKNVSFISFADPRFYQVADLVAGMDYAFPTATKIGGILGSGSRSPSRAMFAWNAPPKNAAKQVEQREVVPEIIQQEPPKPSNFFDSLRQAVSRFTSSNWLDDSRLNLPELMSRAAQDDGSDSDDDDDDGSDEGMYMYGAVVLLLHGDVVIDTLLAQGYRAPSPKIWRVVSCEDEEILTLVEEGKNRDEAEVVAYEALLELFQCVAQEKAAQLQAKLMDALPDSVSLGDVEGMAITDMVASVADDREPESWKVVRLGGLVDKYGFTVEGGRVEPGYRLKLLIRDKQGLQEDLREQLLRYKRKDLGAMMTGSALPPTFGVLLFTDYSRGVEFYGEEHYESRTIAQYLPVPLSGVQGSGQICSVDGDSDVYEHGLVVGVLRATGARPGSQTMIGGLGSEDQA